jgi:hypothetical protein
MNEVSDPIKRVSRESIREVLQYCPRQSPREGSKPRHEIARKIRKAVLGCRATCGTSEIQVEEAAESLDAGEPLHAEAIVTGPAVKLFAASVIKGVRHGGSGGSSAGE